MLVLSRKKDESVVIPSCEITITVLEIRGDKVRLGFEAPMNTAVHRSEVQDAILRQLAAENRGREGE